MTWVKSYGGAVISLGNELQGVQDGLVDIGCTILVFEASRLPLQDMVYSMPFSCSDPLIVAETIKQIYSEYPEFTETYEKNYNQKFIGIGVSDPYGFYSTKEVRSLEDVNGMKIGAAGINLSWIEGSGAVGVQTSLNDTYQNLQTNVCQATIQPTRSCVNLKVYEVAPYYLDANFNVVPFNSITVNLDTWNDLPQEIQTILTEVGEGYLDYEANYINEVHEQDLKTLEEQGCTIVLAERHVIANLQELLGQARGKVAKIFYCPFHPFDPGFPELKKGGPACEGLRGIEMDMEADWGTGAWLRGTPGPEIIRELTPQPGDVVVEGKKTLDAFHSTGLDYYLRANEIEYVAFTGFHTDWCVESSARSAYDKGYRVIVISDCTATDTQEEQDFCERWIFPKIGKVMNYREFLEALE